MRKIPLAAILSILILSGCATQVQQRQIRATIDSYPAGAILTVLGPNGPSGPAPQTWTWNLKPGSPTGTIPVMARWVSGATATQTVTIGAGQDMAVSIQRPSAPGLDADVQWAIAAQRRTDAKTQEDQIAIGLALRSFNDDREARIRQQPAPKQPISCTSTVRSGRVDTDCL
jgi:hypothetical protein